MSYQEKRTILNMVSTVIISVAYFAYVLGNFPDESMNTEALLRFWGKAILVLIPVTIVAKIAIAILFGITNAIATRERSPGTDERDKLIELKAMQIGRYVFGLGFLLAMAALAMDMSVNVTFLIIVSGGMVSEVLENAMQLRYYKRGF